MTERTKIGTDALKNPVILLFVLLLTGSGFGVGSIYHSGDRESQITRCVQELQIEMREMQAIIRNIQQNNVKDFKTFSEQIREIKENLKELTRALQNAKAIPKVRIIDREVRKVGDYGNLREMLKGNY